VGEQQQPDAGDEDCQPRPDRQGRVGTGGWQLTAGTPGLRVDPDRGGVVGRVADRRPSVTVTSPVEAAVPVISTTNGNSQLSPGGSGISLTKQW
jgi:hypothetical protein